MKYLLHPFCAWNKTWVTYSLQPCSLAFVLQTWLSCVLCFSSWQEYKAEIYLEYCILAKELESVYPWMMKIELVHHKDAFEKNQKQLECAEKVNFWCLLSEASEATVELSIKFVLIVAKIVRGCVVFVGWEEKREECDCLWLVHLF